MSNYESKQILFLGKTPTHIPQEKLMDYFLYTFEFVWTAQAFDLYRDDLTLHFTTLLNEVKEKEEKPLTIGQEWWALVLIALKDLASNENYTFPMETIQFILNRIHTLNDEELIDYANSINNVFYTQVSEVLSLRPLEINPLQSNSIEEDNVLAYFMDKKDEIIKLFNARLEQSDIDSVYLSELLVNGEEINNQFTDFWNSYFEIFTGFSISMFDMVNQSENTVGINKEQIVKETILVFIISSLKNNKKADDLASELTKIILPLYTETQYNTEV